MVGKWLAGGLAFGGCGRGLSRAQVLHANHESVDEDATRSEKREWRMAVKSDSADVLLAKYSTVPVTRDRKNEAPSCSRGPTPFGVRRRFCQCVRSAFFGDDDVIGDGCGCTFSASILDGSG